MNADLPKINGNDALNMSIQIPMKGIFDELINFRVNLIKTPACESQSKDPQNLLAEFQMLQQFEYEIIPRKNDKVAKNILLNKIQDFAFVHSYKLLNQGPSPTDLPYEFYLYIPNLIVDDPKNVKKLFDVIPPNNPNVTCANPKKAKTLNIQQVKEGQNHISCKTHECLIYDCKVLSKWKIGEQYSKSIKLMMTLEKHLFSGKKPGKLQTFDEFFIWTALSHKTGDSVKTYITENTKFISNRSGNWQAKIAEYWPIVIGLFIVIVVLVSVIYALYKTGVLKRLRFYHPEDSDTQVRKSQRASKLSQK